MKNAAISTLQHVSGSSTGAVAIELIDPRLVQENIQYTISFGLDSAQALTYTVLRDSAGVQSALVSNLPVVTQEALLPQARRFAAYFDSLLQPAAGDVRPDGSISAWPRAGFTRGSGFTCWCRAIRCS